jgi:hypothetical protein
MTQTCRIFPPLRERRGRCDDGGVRLLRLVALVGPAVLLACATPATRSTPAPTALAARVEGPGLLFELIYTSADAQDVPRIEQGLLAAGARVARWGSFREGIHVHLLPDHASLEDAVDRHGYPWLRAWAFGDQVLLQSPRSWSDAAPAKDEELVELLTHELTHALMYQLMQTANDPPWAAEEPPLWFREGMASVTADQGRRRLSAGELAAWSAAHPGADLLRPDAALYRDEKDAVYAAAHRAFDLLVQITSEDAVRRVLQQVSTGTSFPDAFRATTGYALEDFEREALRSGFDPKLARFTTATGAGGP